MDRAIRVELPYPTLKNCKKDKRLAAILSAAYAGGHGELKAILQYVYHYLNFKSMGDDVTAETVMGIFLCEMKHLQILGELILALGGDPVYATATPFGLNYFSTAKVWYGKTPEKMLIDDLTLEILSVSEYEKIMGETNDEEVLSIIERLIIDEKLHEKALKERLGEIGKKDCTGFNFD